MPCVNERETICYRKKQIDVSFLFVCPATDNEFRPRHVMTKFLINNKTDA